MHSKRSRSSASARMSAAALVSALALTTALPGAAMAETSIPVDRQTGIAVTIYNNDLALVRDTRRITLAAGDNDLAFVDVSAGIRPETALLTAQRGKLSIIEQNFDFDLLTPQALLSKSVGQTIRVVREHPQTGAEEEVEAQVLSVVDGQVVLQIGNRIETAVPGRLAFSAVPENLRARPTLVVRVNSAEAGEISADLNYLTHGLSWAADYVAELSPDESMLNLNGWVTLTNRSGASYRDAQLQLVAGDVNQAPPMMEMMDNMAMVASAPAPQAKMRQEEAFEYHLYSLERATTLKENQTKQVALMAAEQIPVTKEYILRNPGSFASRRGEPARQNADVRLRFENDQASKLGLPLPAGVIRVYKKDSDGDAIFVGEDRIDHTPNKERVELTMGKAFDVTARSKRTGFTQVSDTVTESAYEVEVKNGKSQKVTLLVRENIGGDWKMLEESQKHEKLDAGTAQWAVEIPAEGTVTLTYKVRSTY